LLLAWGRGEEAALETLVPILYAELHRLARRYMRGEPANHTLQASALVNEAYLRLIDSRRVQWQNHDHFLAVAAQLMRRILVDFARSRRSGKRGGENWRVTLTEGLERRDVKTRDLVALDDALIALAARDSRKAQVIELLLRRAERWRNGRRAGRLRGHRDPRLEVGSRLAATRTERWSERCRSVTGGGRWM
jgi:RNA polymerase sigma factor (TIGR02999 family)